MFDLARENHFINKSNQEELKSIHSMCKEIREEVKNSRFQMKMETIDAKKYFPVNDNKELEIFLKQDDAFPMRRRGFHDLLKCVATTTKKKFSEALLNLLFTLNYKREIRWPSTKKKSPDSEYVPDNFIHFLKSTLAKMSGLGYIQDDFIDLQFWNSLPAKFRSFKFYGVSL